MNKSNLVKIISRSQKLTAEQVEGVLDAFVDETAAALKSGDKVTIAGLGRFEMRSRGAKSFTNPKTGKASRLAPTSTPGFKFSGLFKELVK